MRLDKLLSNLGAASRSGCREMLRKGRVTVNGVPALEPSRGPATWSAAYGHASMHFPHLMQRARKSASLWIPGGRNRSFSLDGRFVNGTGTVQVRQTGQTASSINADEAVVRTGTTPSDSNTYEIIFSKLKNIA